MAAVSFERFAVPYDASGKHPSSIKERDKNNTKQYPNFISWVDDSTF